MTSLPERSFWARHGFLTPAFWVCVFLIVASFSLAAYGVYEVRHVSENNLHAHCSLRQGYQEQLDRTNQYLENPVKFKIAQKLGFTRGELRTTRDSLQRRIDDLGGLEC